MEAEFPKESEAKELNSRDPEANGSRAMPMVMPARVAFIATPGIELATSLSPGSIGPFSRETLAGIRPDRATATFWTDRLSLLPEPLSNNPGFFEITPITIWLPDAFLTNS